jgi:hypothetical protein
MLDKSCQENIGMAADYNEREGNMVSRRRE